VSLASEVDLEARNAVIADIWEEAKAETLYLPIHHQVLNWGHSSAWETPVDADDQAKFKYFKKSGS
jgi:peptide/nickel transport system substrate-binding protein